MTAAAVVVADPAAVEVVHGFCFDVTCTCGGPLVDFADEHGSDTTRQCEVTCDDCDTTWVLTLNMRKRKTLTLLGGKR